MKLAGLWISAIALAGLLSGLGLAHVLERPAKLGYDAPLYLTLQKSLYVQWGPPHFGGWLEPAAIIATAALAIALRNRRRGLLLILFALSALLTAFPLVFFWLVAPANAGFLAATLPGYPVDWDAMRQNWETGHAMRFGLQLSALLALVSSLALEATQPRFTTPGPADKTSSRT